jgi:hypothetical protein
LRKQKHVPRRNAGSGKKRVDVAAKKRSAPERPSCDRSRNLTFSPPSTRGTRTRRVQDWLAVVERAVEDLAEDERAQVLARLEQARALVGGADALEPLKRWKPPGERP